MTNLSSRGLTILICAVLLAVLSGTGGAMAAMVITGANVKDGSLTGVDVKNGSLGAADLALGSVRSGEIADGQVASADLANGSVSGADVKDESLTGADVADGSLTLSDLGGGSNQTLAADVVELAKSQGLFHAGLHQNYTGTAHVVNYDNMEEAPDGTGTIHQVPALSLLTVQATSLRNVAVRVEVLDWRGYVSLECTIVPSGFGSGDTCATSGLFNPGRLWVRVITVDGSAPDVTVAIDGFAVGD